MKYVRAKLDRFNGTCSLDRESNSRMLGVLFFLIVYFKKCFMFFSV